MAHHKEPESSLTVQAVHNQGLLTKRQEEIELAWRRYKNWAQKGIVPAAAVTGISLLLTLAS